MAERSNSVEKRITVLPLPFCLFVC